MLVENLYVTFILSLKGKVIRVSDSSSSDSEDQYDSISESSDEQTEGSSSSEDENETNSTSKILVSESREPQQNKARAVNFSVKVCS